MIYGYIECKVGGLGEKVFLKKISKKKLNILPENNSQEGTTPYVFEYDGLIPEDGLKIYIRNL